MLRVVVSGISQSLAAMLAYVVAVTMFAATSGSSLGLATTELQGSSTAAKHTHSACVYVYRDISKSFVTGGCDVLSVVFNQ